MFAAKQFSGVYTIISNIREKCRRLTPNSSGDYIESKTTQLGYTVYTVKCEIYAKFRDFYAKTDSLNLQEYNAKH